MTRTNSRTSSERASRSTPRSDALDSNADHADSQRSVDPRSARETSRGCSKPSSSRTTTDAGEAFEPPSSARLRFAAPRPTSDSTPLFKPGIEARDARPAGREWEAAGMRSSPFFAVTPESPVRKPTPRSAKPAPRSAKTFFRSRLRITTFARRIQSRSLEILPERVVWANTQSGPELWH